MRVTTILATAGLGEMLFTAEKASSARDRRRFFWFGVWLALLVLALLWLRRCRLGCGVDYRHPVIPPKFPPPPQPPAPPKPPIDLTRIVSAPTVLSPEPPPDDLRRIEGIGPKIAQLLQGAGISTYTQLAMTLPEDLTQILRAAGLRFIDPGTWPEQSALAARGDWEAFATLQGELKGGRRV